MVAYLILWLIPKGHDNDIHSAVFKEKTKFLRFTSGISGNQLIGFHKITLLYLVGFSY